jgi:hypothetical protein
MAFGTIEPRGTRPCGSFPLPERPDFGALRRRSLCDMIDRKPLVTVMNHGG